MQNVIDIFLKIKLGVLILKQCRGYCNMTDSVVSVPFPVSNSCIKTFHLVMSLNYNLTFYYFSNVFVFGSNKE